MTFPVDQHGPDSGFLATGSVVGDRVTVLVIGEVDMSTADSMFQAATRDNTCATTLDHRTVTFFDSAAVHALIRLAKHYPGTLEVIPSEQAASDRITDSSDSPAMSARPATAEDE